MSSENALSPHYNANSNPCLASRIITVAEQNSTVNSFKVFRQRTRKQPLWGNMAFVCAQGPKSVCTKQHFSLCTDFNLSDKNLIQLCFFQRELKQIQEHCRKYPPPPLVQTMGAVCAFDQGYGYVDDNEKSAGCPKSVVTLPSKYTRFFFLPNILFVCSRLRCVDFILYLSRSVGNTNKAQN